MSARKISIAELAGLEGKGATVNRKMGFQPAGTAPPPPPPKPKPEVDSNMKEVLGTMVALSDKNSAVLADNVQALKTITGLIEATVKTRPEISYDFKLIRDETGFLKRVEATPRKAH